MATLLLVAPCVISLAAYCLAWVLVTRRVSEDQRTAGTTALVDGAEPLPGLSVLKPLCAALSSALGAPAGGPAAAAAPADWAALEPTLRQLAKMLADNDGDALDFSDEHADALRSALAAGFAQFDGALKAYEFDTALEKLKSACATGGVKL